MQTNFDKPMRYYIARRPQFLDFCERYALVARWVHRESVGSLPFADDAEGRALAASVGSTVEELNAEPVDELAADVVTHSGCYTRSAAERQAPARAEHSHSAHVIPGLRCAELHRPGRL